MHSRDVTRLICAILAAGGIVAFSVLMGAAMLTTYAKGDVMGFGFIALAVAFVLAIVAFILPNRTSR